MPARHRSRVELRHEVLEALSAAVEAHGDFFRQGKDLFEGTGATGSTDGGLTSFLKGELSDQVTSMRKEAATLERQLEKRHTHVSDAAQDLALVQGGSGGADSNRKKEQGGGTLQGYLFKRGQSAFRTWNRRWFYLQDNQLRYSRRSGEEVTVMEEDLRICLVRPCIDVERRFCFEVISPTKSHVLQV